MTNPDSRNRGSLAKTKMVTIRRLERSRQPADIPTVDKAQQATNPAKAAGGVAFLFRGAVSIAVDEENKKAMSNVSNASRDSDAPSGGESPQSTAPEMLPCPHCRGGMVEGWIPSVVSGTSTYTAPRWMPGPPPVKKSKSLGFIEVHTLVSPDGKNSLPVAAFRCVRCGFLKLYARDIG